MLTTGEAAMVHLDDLLDPHLRLDVVRPAGGGIVDFVIADANWAALTAAGLSREHLVGER